MIFPIEPTYSCPVGFFDTLPFQEEERQDDGSTIIRQYDEVVYCSADGTVLMLDDLEKIIKFYEEHSDDAEKLEKLKVEYRMSEEAHQELIESQKKELLQKIEFVCAFITHFMRPHLDADELYKLHANASRSVDRSEPAVHPVYFKQKTLIKEDLKHLGYNIGKFLDLDGLRIGQFVKNVFPEEFGSTQINTIVQKLTENKSKDGKIPILTKKQMDDLFFQFQLKQKIDVSIIYGRR